MRRWFFYCILLALLTSGMVPAAARQSVPTPTPRFDLSPAETVVFYFDLVDQKKWHEAWLYLERSTKPAPGLDEAGYVLQHRLLHKHNPRMGVSAEILHVTMLPEWEAPEMTVRYQESEDGPIKTWVVPARRWSPVAEVAARITWTGCRGCEKGVSVEEVTLHLVHVDGRWKLLFSGPTNLM